MDKHLHEEFENVRKNQPLWPGDTINHAQAYELQRLKLIKRNAEGNWVTTELGDACALAGAIVEDGT